MRLSIKSALARYKVLSLRWRILGTIGLFFSLAILLGGVAISVNLYQSDQREWQERQVEATRSGAILIETFISEQWKDLEVLASLPGEVETQAALAERITRPGAPFLEVVAVDEEGQIIFGARQGRAVLANLFTISQSNWFTSARQNESFISDVAFDAEDQPYLILAVPDSDDGVIAGRLRMDILFDVIAGIRFGRSGQAYLVRRTGELIAHNNLDFVYAQTNLSQQPNWLELADIPESHWQGAYNNFEGRRVVGTSAPIGETDWILIGELPQAEAFRTTLNSVAMIAAGLLLSVTLAWIATRYIADRLVLQPLQQLKEGAKRFGDGQYDQIIKMNTGDEFQSLADTFNLMAFSIQDRETVLIAARNKAQEGERFKTHLLASVSHELRTPLGGILGNAEMLNFGIFGPLNEQQQRAAAKIISNSEFLSSLVSDLLDQATIETGRLRIRNEPFSPHDVLDKLVTRMSVLAQKKDLYLRGSLADDLPGQLSGDEDRVLQILINLVSNAIRFTARGGVEVYAGLYDQEHWMLRVTDTGIGISPSDQALIFEPFRRLDSSLARQHSGTGLGLSIVAGIVSQMNGRLELESQPGEGSTFTVILPLDLVPEATESKVVNAT